MDNPICFALDVPSSSEAQRLIDKLEDSVGAFKIGLELFIVSGKLPTTNRPVVLDLKLHDIPETVGRAVRAGGDIGAKFMTLHIQQRAALEAAMKAAEPFGIKLLGVTVLTSMDDGDLRDLQLGPNKGFADDISSRAHQLMRFGIQCGLRGFVCSPQEIRNLRLNCTEKEQPFLLVPGIRPDRSDNADQKRVGTPGKAIRDGANLIVVGRPIRDAEDPRLAAEAILSECRQASSDDVQCSGS